MEQTVEAYSDEAAAIFLDPCKWVYDDSECSCVITESEKVMSEDEFAAWMAGDQESPAGDAILVSCIPDWDDDDPDPVAVPYSTPVRDDYLAECAEMGGEFCLCTLHEFEKQFTEDEFLRLFDSVDAESADTLFEAMTPCMELYVGP